MLNEQFAWLTPFSQLDWPGFAWRTRGRTGVNTEGRWEVAQLFREIIPAGC
jgi:hypothetical protein